MNILKNLLFSYKGKIGRADYIYGITYTVLLFFVSIDIFINPPSIYLFGGGIDKGVLFQYVASVLGLAIFAWSFFAVVSKRMRTLRFDLRFIPFALLFPITLFFGFMSDEETFEYPSGFSWTDQVFFYVIVGVSVVSFFVIHRLEAHEHFLVLLATVIAGVTILYYALDRLPFRHSESLKYQGWDTWIDLGFVLVIVLFFRSFIFSPFQIIGPSMEDTFHGGAIYQDGKNDASYGDGEYILVDKMTYRMNTPRRGDVVVFTPGIGPEKRYLIKRVIGIPGDVVKIENGYVSIAAGVDKTQFTKLDESPYLGQKFGHTCLGYGQECGVESQKFTIPEGRYFLMGDNRPQSLDARKCFNGSGCIGEYTHAQYVPLSRIQGRVAFSLGHFDLFGQILPFPKIGTFKQVTPFRGLNIKNSHTYSELHNQ